VEEEEEGFRVRILLQRTYMVKERIIQLQLEAGVKRPAQQQDGQPTP
jgi:hypothetical protein